MNPKVSAKLTIVFFIFAVFSASIAYGGTVADVIVSPERIEWQPIVIDAELALTVSGPENAYYKETFAIGIPASFERMDNSGNLFPDGSCTYELSVIPVIDPVLREALQEARESGNTILAAELMKGMVPPEPLVQSGYFSIQDGTIVMGQGSRGSSLSGQDPIEGGDRMKSDVLHYDDVIITGSLCTGFDCSNGESFGFDTLILKENNLRIYFNDTSNSASFPTNNWRITINDSTNGGASYFSIDDVDDGTSIFKLEAGAPSNSLYVEDYGRVGLGTSTPVVELHIKDSDTPTVRLEQDGSGGWTPQTWDVAGNESNFFVRDATNGSKLPFRIQPNTPSSTLNLKSDGNVGIGTWSPSANLDIETTGQVTMEMNDVSGEAWDLIVDSTGVREGFSITRVGSGTREFRIANNGNVYVMGVQEHPDYVFEPDYKLIPLSDLAEYIKREKRLPDMPSAATFQNEGVNLSAMPQQLLKKVEELTLYTLEQQRIIEELRMRLAALEKNRQPVQ